MDQTDQYCRVFKKQIKKLQLILGFPNKCILPILNFYILFNPLIID